MRRPHLKIPPPLYNEVKEPQKQILGSRVIWIETDPCAPSLDLNPALHTVEIDMINGTLVPVETHLITPSTPQLNDMLNQITEQTDENEN